MKVPLRAGRGALVRSEQRSILPSRRAQLISRVGDAGWEPLVRGRTRATILGAQPNQRLKLTAPRGYRLRIPPRHPVRYTFVCEYSNSAPQLKRISLGCAGNHKPILL